MIRWCSYCQSFQGEIEPFDDYSMTHMICERCDSHALAANEPDLAPQREVAAYYGELRTLVREGRIDDATLLLDQAPGLGIVPSDLVAGLVQPLVHWLSGFLSETSLPAILRDYTGKMAVFLEQLALRYPELERFRNVDSPRVLLVAAAGEFGWVGDLMAELTLAAHAVSSRVVSFDGDVWAILTQIRQCQPQCLGFGVSSEDQLLAIEGLVERLREEPSLLPMMMLVGGLPIRMGLTLDSKLGVHHCRSAMDIVRHLSQPVSAGKGRGLYLNVDSQRGRANSKPAVS
ncbi:MAG: hypothetical protein QM784_33980 [Polyangiaceae bacterium]